VADSEDRIQFGSFTLARQRRQLLASGAEVHLSPKAFALLAFLIEQRPRVVTKRELIDLLWPDTFVEEQNVKNLVNELRAALGDRAKAPQFIRTAFGLGYAFCFEAVQEQTQARGTLVAAYLVAPAHLYTIFSGRNLLGRGSDCSVILDARGVSRHHSTITASGAELLVEDLESKNGTWLNESRIDSPARLYDGDLLRLGTAAMTVRIASDEETSTIAR
jgi:DNA-binding winged helix-turn-helix (wHTH) protein